MVLTTHRALQFAGSVLGMFVYAKSCLVFPKLLGDLVQNISSENKTHFVIFTRPPPDIKTAVNPPFCQYPAFLYVETGQ